MKRFLMLLSTLFCTTIFADTITINWGVDNQPYTTTTCEIGDDVILPSVSKRGHIFRGWQAEHFDRGTFASWLTVPSNVSEYVQDKYGNHTPLYGDHIILINSNNYTGIDYDKNMKITLNGSQNNQKIIISYDGTTVIRTGSVVASGYSEYFGPNNEIRIDYGHIDGYGCLIAYANKPLKINDQVINSGSLIGYQRQYASGTVERTVFYGTPLNGTWKFVYGGVWDTDNKNGWKPSEQIVNE